MQNVSILMDGELAGDEARREIARVKGDGDVEGDVSGPGARRDAWDAYHVIRDVMRESTAGTPVVSAAFSTRFSARLAQEPTVLAPHALKPVLAKRRFQTYALSAAASAVAVAVVGWVALSNTKPADVSGSELAKAPVTPPQMAVALVAKPSPAPTHMHEYLLAHQGISPTTAFQGVAPYVRTVSTVGN